VLKKQRKLWGGLKEPSAASTKTKEPKTPRALDHRGTGHCEGIQKRGIGHDNFLKAKKPRHYLERRAQKD